jgi:hypothetical protein
VHGKGGRLHCRSLRFTRAAAKSALHVRMRCTEQMQTPVGIWGYPGVNDFRPCAACREAKLARWQQPPLDQKRRLLHQYFLSETCSSSFCNAEKTQKKLQSCIRFLVRCSHTV